MDSTIFILFDWGCHYMLYHTKGYVFDLCDEASAICQLRKDIVAFWAHMMMLYVLFNALSAVYF